MKKLLLLSLFPLGLLAFLSVPREPDPDIMAITADTDQLLADAKAQNASYEAAKERGFR